MRARATLGTSYWIQAIAVAYIATWAISPPLAFGLKWRLLAGAATGIWFVIEASRSTGIVQKPSWPVIVAVVLVLYTLLVEFLVPDSRQATGLFQIWILWLFLVFFCSFIRSGGRALYPFFYLFVILMPAWMIMTLIGYETVGSHVSRTLVRSSDEARLLSAMGIGGYGMVYSLVAALPVLAYFSLKWESIRLGSKPRVELAVKLLVRLNFLLAVVVILKAGFSIAVIISVISMAILAVQFGSRLVLFRSIALVLSVFLLSTILLQPAISVLTDLARGTEYRQKLEDVEYSLADGDTSGTLNTRWEKYSKSLVAFARNPIVGTLKYDYVGKHSSYLDHFAQYGVFFGALFFVLVVVWPFRLLRSPAVPRSLGLSVLFVVLALPMVNNIFGAFGFVVFLFYPASIAVLIQSRELGRSVVRARRLPLSHSRSFRSYEARPGSTRGLRGEA